MTDTDPLHHAEPTDTPHNAWRAGYRHAWNDSYNGLKSRKSEANPYPETDPRSLHLAATREALAKILDGAHDIKGNFDTNDALDALLAPGGPIQLVSDVQAAAWDEGHDAGWGDRENDEYGENPSMTSNPYRSTDPTGSTKP